MKWLFSALVILVMCSGVTRAQTLLYLPLNARDTGMAAGIADNSVPGTISFNPANVVGSPRAYLAAIQQGFGELLSDDNWARRADAGASWKLDPSSAWVFGANLAYAKLHTDFFFDRDENLWSLALGAGYSAGARSQIRLGGAIKRLDADVFNGFGGSFNEIETTNVDGVAYDVGVVFSYAPASEDDWGLTSQFGLAVLDQGPDIEGPYYSEELPARVGVGASFRIASPLDAVMSTRVPTFTGIINLDAQLPNDGDAYYSAGVEASVSQILFGRFGILVVPDNAFGDDSVTSWSVGFGVPAGTFRFRLDIGNQGSSNDDDSISLLALKEL
jgi:hypothetical protein